MKRWILPYLLAAAALLAVGLPLKVRLDAPRLGSPAILTLGRSFWIECRTSLPWVPKSAVMKALAAQWGVRPDGDGLHLLESTAHGNRYRFKVEAPGLGTKGMEKGRGPAEVWGYAEWPERFRLVHVADFPSAGKEEMLVSFVDEMAVVRPSAVLVSGDLAYDPDPAWFAFLAGQFRRLESMGIPVIACPGNHERKGWSQYLRTFGPYTFHRADLGPLAILSLDSAHGRDQLTPSQFSWLRGELNRLEGRTAIIQVHHPVFPPGKAVHGDGEKSGGTLGAFRSALVRLCREKNVAAVLSGHWHQDAVFDASGNFRDDRADFEGTKFIVTTALGDSTRRVVRWPHRYFGYRILEFDHGRLVRYTHDLPGLPSPVPVASTPLGTYLKKEVRQ